MDSTTVVSPIPLSPTSYGYIASTRDALLLFELCLSGALKHIGRRPFDRERSDLIKSGNVFIYEERISGMKRWTDGVPWSPSRILGDFLLYRELNKPCQPGERKSARTREKKLPGTSKKKGVRESNHTLRGGHTPNSLSEKAQRCLVGSLTDSYDFNETGLVKKAVSITVNGVSHHLVSFYKVADVENNILTTPSKDIRFQDIRVRPELQQCFKMTTQMSEPSEYGGSIVSPYLHAGMLQSARYTEDWQVDQNSENTEYYGAAGQHGYLTVIRRPSQDYVGNT